MSKARKFLAFQRTGEALNKVIEKANHEVWSAVYAKELKKAGLLNRNQLGRQIAKKRADEVTDPEMSFKAADLIWQLVTELEDMNKFGVEEALDRTRELGAKAEVKVEEEGDSIKKEKAHEAGPVLKKRPVARMMCTKRTASQVSSKGEEVTTKKMNQQKPWARQFVITLQGKEKKKKKVMKAVLVSYSSDSEDDYNEGFQGENQLSVDKKQLEAAFKDLGGSGSLREVWYSKKDGEKVVVHGRFDAGE